MSVSAEVQRTLVKSPPELWAELSDPTALARHLGELGEIRIVRIDPETTIEWETCEVAGRVQISPSGWGTTVTLIATRVLPEPEPPDLSGSHLHADGATPAGGETPSASEPDCALAAVPALAPALAFPPVTDTAPDCEISFESEHRQAQLLDASETPPEAKRPLEPRRSFLFRLFGRRRALDPADVAPPADPAAPSDPAPPSDTAPRDDSTPSADLTPSAPSGEPPGGVAFDPQARALPKIGTAAPPESERLVPVPVAWPGEPLQPAPPPQPIGEPALGAAELKAEQDHAAELRAEQERAAGLKAEEERAAEQVTAVLSSVLDRLGAAHHRPFSRP